MCGTLSPKDSPHPTHRKHYRTQQNKQQAPRQCVGPSRPRTAHTQPTENITEHSKTSNKRQGNVWDPLAQGQPTPNPQKTLQNTAKQATSAKAMCGTLSPKDSPHPTHRKHYRT